MKLKLIFLSIVGALALGIFQNLDHDWDLPAYIGCVENLKSDDVETIHGNTFSILKEELSAKEYKIISGVQPKSAYRKAMARDGNLFHDQLPYYNIKSLFVALIYFFSLFTTIIKALLLINLICFFVTAFFISEIFLLFPIKRWAAYFVTILILLLPSTVNISTSASPDLLSVTFLTYLIYSFLKGEKFIYQVLISLLLLLTRPDYLIFIFLFFSINIVFKKVKFPLYFLSILVLFAVYFAIVRINQFPGWSALIYDSFFQRRLSMGDSKKFEMLDYFKLVWRNFLSFKKIIFASLVALLSYVYFFKKTNCKLTIEFALVVLLYLNIYIKFIIFPAAAETRFYYGFMLILGIFAIKSFCDFLQIKRRLIN